MSILNKIILIKKTKKTKNMKQNIKIGDKIYYKEFTRYKGYGELKETTVTYSNPSYFKVSDKIGKIRLNLMVDNPTPNSTHRRYFFTPQHEIDFFETLELCDKFKVFFNVEKNIFSVEQLRAMNDIAFTDKSDTLTLSFLTLLGLRNKGFSNEAAETKVVVELPCGVELSDTISHEYDEENLDEEGYAELIINDEINFLMCHALYSSDNVFFGITKKSELCKLMFMDYKQFIDYVAEQNPDFNKKQHMEYYNCDE